jgi:nitroimidazol reductase NimA-like FMN-containing flavoprotein (pyridoxamine 5'-phosphate oxidase superfamily)
MKNFEAEKGIGMTESQARKFLTHSRSTLLLGTTDAGGSPMIHPVWYYFDPAKTKLYFYTEPALKKAINIRERSQIYFDVDSDRWPYKGVKGKGNARIIADKEESLSYGRKILAKYVKRGKPFFKSVLEKMRSGGYVVFEITPAYFTSWDYGRTDPRTTRAFRDAIIS